MPRIPLFPLTDMTPEQRDAYETASSGPGGPVRGPTTAVLHNPELARSWRAMGDLLRFKTSLPLRLSEIAILVAARRWTAQFVWSTHTQAGLKAGISAATIESIRTNQRPSSMAADETAVYDFAHELAEHGKVNAAVYQRALGAFGTTGVVELTVLVGYYSMVAMTVNAHEIAVPDGSVPLPPRAG